jgi:hypothetical protein
MKKITIITVLLFAVNTIKAQGNLQFNEVKNIDITGVLPLGYELNTIGSITVPSGKVWKIESVFSFENTAPVGPNALGGISTLIGNHKATTSGSPIWLSPGNYLIKCVTGGGINVSVLTSISAIEFNVTP